MKKSLSVILLLALLPVQAAFAEPRSEVVRVDVPANKTAQNELPAAMRRELERAMVLVRNHQTAEAMPLLNRLVGQADAELRRHKNVRAAGNRVHTLRLLLEAANSGRDTEVVSSEWLMPRYVRAFAHVEQKNYAAAVAELDAVLAVAPYEPQFLAERGQVANAMKDFAAAERTFKRLQESAKTLPDPAQAAFYQGAALRGLGYGAVERGQWQAAEQYYRQALQLNPNDRAAQNELQFVRQHRR